MTNAILPIALKYWSTIAIGLGAVPSCIAWKAYGIELFVKRPFGQTKHSELPSGEKLPRGQTEQVPLPAWELYLHA